MNTAPSPRLALERDLPLLVLHEPAARGNVEAMARSCDEHGVLLSPHAKTHMVPELIQLQLDHGAWGMTAATPRQVRLLHGCGVSRILHANLVVDSAFIDWIVATVLNGEPEIRYLCYVDSVEAVELLASRLHSPMRPLDVLLERGFAGGRTGTRTRADTLRVAEAVAQAPTLRLAGVAGFEGLAPRVPGEHRNAVPRLVDALLHEMHETVMDLREQKLLGPEPIVTAGGSSYFDRAVKILGPSAWDEPVTTILRSGCYIVHDHGMYAETTPSARTGHGPAFTAALELLARVLSRPEPGLALIGFGRRDVPTDERLPVPLGPDGNPRSDWFITAVNDHHAFLRTPRDQEPAPGEVLRFGISHPCGGFDRHREITVVDAEGRPVGEMQPML